jgi:hypothetical protein
MAMSRPRKASAYNLTARRARTPSRGDGSAVVWSMVMWLLLLGHFTPGHLPGAKTRMASRGRQGQAEAARSSNVFRCARARTSARRRGLREDGPGRQGQAEAGAGLPGGRVEPMD